MALQAKFCAQCGAPLKSRVVEGRPRELCPRCGIVFYQNPLPAAASVVLNDNREVLLVKRKNEPEKGKWCLPIGFAELGETIAEAAVRELQEETGVTGRITRLLDTQSHKSNFYGDLLIVSFEVQKIGGEEQAGDDAEDVKYFHLDEIPPLAFGPNERAIRMCERAHTDEWAIQDSFNRLHADEGQEMLSDALVDLLEEHAEEIAKPWLQDLRTNRTTPSYKRIHTDGLKDRGEVTVLQFGRWLKGKEDEHEIRSFYRAIGRERKAMGFALHEVLSSLTLMRKHIWEFAHVHGVWEKPIDLYRALELDRRVMVFFDRAMYQITRGYEESENTP
jgi:ADP-ribose pyrophosphatase YjhB (NUDIX family)